MITPYYEEKEITIYCGAAEDVIWQIDLESVDLVLTDPPYGIGGSKGTNKIRGKTDYGADEWEDTETYVIELIERVIEPLIGDVDRMILTPGNRMLTYYPAPDDIGCFWLPSGKGWGRWGLATYSPILYYGKDPRAGTGQSPSGRQLTEVPEKTGHPCPKPLNAWKWLLNKGSLEGETVLDPFMGSGTTLVAAKHLGRKAIGIDISEEYCQIAVDRLRQGVLL